MQVEHRTAMLRGSAGSLKTLPAGSGKCGLSLAGRALSGLLEKEKQAREGVTAADAGSRPRNI
uniref:Uncharacterized protein n=1 Tax=Thermofilum pendens TaxID=2269 RepID=A0A7C4H9R6_THEPE